MNAPSRLHQTELEIMHTERFSLSDYYRFPITDKHIVAHIFASFNCIFFENILHFQFICVIIKPSDGVRHLPKGI